MTSFNDLPIEIIRLIFEYFTPAETVHLFSPINYKMKAIGDKHMAAAREQHSMNSDCLPIIQIEDDDDIDYEQLFDDYEVSSDNSKSEIKKPTKRVRFAPILDDNSLTPTLSRPPSVRPTFEVEFDFDSLATPSIELNKDISHMPSKSIENINWKDAFLSDLHIAKKNKTTIVTSPSIIQTENKTNEDTLWDFMKESNPELLEKLERTNNDKQKRIDRFSMQQTMTNTKPMSIPNEEDEFNQVHEELLHFLLPYHKILCKENIWPQEHNFTSPNISLELIKTICKNDNSFNLISNRSDILKHLMFIYTITSFLYVFAYCSLQTAIRHVENVIVQNMKNVCIDQERGKPLFDLLTKTHQKFENIPHPKILHIKHLFKDFFDKRRQLIDTTKQIFEPKFLLLVQYESIDLLHDIERGLSSLIELHCYVYDKQTNINRDEFNDLLMYNNMIIIRTRQISSTIIVRPKRLTLVIEYEYGEQILQWYQFCQQQIISYIAYKTILPSFIAPEKEEFIEITQKIASPIMKEEFLTLPTIVLARPLVDNFKLLRTLECRHDISIITRDYHLLGIPIDQQPDILIDWTTSMLIFDLNTKLDINTVRHKIQSMTLHSCRIHVAILTSGSIPDFILSTYITPITQLAKQIQENESNIDIQIKSFGSLDEFANHVAQLVQQEHSIKYLLTPTPSWNEKMLLRRCSSLNSISAQLVLQRLKTVDLSTVNLEILLNQCPEIPMNYLKTFVSDMHKKLRDTFDLFDRDKSGAISSAELKQVLIALNFEPTDNLLRRVMKEMDADGNGSIEFDEFVKAMRTVYERKFTDDEMRNAFKCFDADNSGYITVSELREVLRRLNHDVSERRISEVLYEIDTDHDGKISYEEFVHMLQDV
ncbi:unnamed protein product [Adineta steineri]|uniref:EF-hand domain-containing protein n=1 Tax=Adineta steineri TaxID=433720 RepID=A0A814EF62_9BILA|nr:unnamed protein product [Adineta steineri]CAF0969041.1 unnamed protein product [Adineta steineri]CAF1509102.1 unnamed protein product [Adineta steineri]CAF1646796.1 unnamed protein product [Adineta steineri]